MKTSLPLVAPVSQFVNENLPVALGFAGVPTAINEPKVTPVAVGTGVGSVKPEPVVTEAKS